MREKWSEEVRVSVAGLLVIPVTLLVMILPLVVAGMFIFEIYLYLKSGIWISITTRYVLSVFDIYLPHSDWVGTQQLIDFFGDVSFTTICLLIFGMCIIVFAFKR